MLSFWFADAPCSRAAGKPSAANRSQTFPDLHTALEEYSRTGDMSVLQGLSNFMGSPEQVGRRLELFRSPSNLYVISKTAALWFFT